MGGWPQDGCGEFYECGPLNQLKGIMKRINAKAHQVRLGAVTWGASQWQGLVNVPTIGEFSTLPIIPFKLFVGDYIPKFVG